jgi:adenylate cyclase
MTIFRIKSLRQRLVLFILLPVGLLLLLMGLLGYFYTRDSILEQWRDASIIKLQRAAEHIDSRLDEPVRWINAFEKSAGQNDNLISPDWLVEQLKDIDGVTEVSLKWKKDVFPSRMGMAGAGMAQTGMMRFRPSGIAEVTAPVYDQKAKSETVSMISVFQNEDGEPVGTLRITILFRALIHDIQETGWWQSNRASLIDLSGNLFAQTGGVTKERKKLGGPGYPLESAILAALREKPFGTVLGMGRSAALVGGFCRLKRAPWAIVLFAPRDKILAPIIRFRLIYGVSGVMSILLILFLILFVVGRMTGPIEKISKAAGSVAKGRYGEPMPIPTRDEVGRLAESFNAMVEGLKEKDFIRNTFGRYVDPEIAKDLISRPDAKSVGGQKRQVAILICDIRGFTPLAESLSPEETVTMLNRYFSIMIEVIGNNQGIIVDFCGDGMLVFFESLRGSEKGPVARAMACALGMQSEIRPLNDAFRKEGLPVLETGIGVHAGEVIVGNIGSEARAKYGIVGSAVNLTQRIQEAAGPGEVVISDSVFRVAKEDLSIRKTLRVKLKGFKEVMNLHVLETFEERSPGASLSGKQGE